MHFRYLFTVLFLSTCRAALDNRGTEFIVGFMDNQVFGTRDSKPELFITTAKSGVVHVHVTTPNSARVHLDERFTLTNGQVHYMKINQHIRLHQTEMSSKGILIEADDEIVMYGNNREAYSDDGYLGLPTDVLGTKYYTASYYPASRYTEFLVIGVTNNTRVSIQLPNDPSVNVTYRGLNYHAGQWINVTMNRLDTLEIHSKGDLTGSHIVASSPVSVLSGNKKTNLGSNGSSDHLVEHLPPVQSWGKTFATVPIPERVVGDIFRFIASEDDTTVTVNGQINNTAFQDTFVLPKAGSYSEKHYDSHLYSSISSDKPIMLVQFSLTQSSHSDEADPSMIIVPPVEQYAADYTFTTPKYSHGNYTNYFMFTIKASDKGGLRLDGKRLPPKTQYHHIPGTNLVGGYVPITPGTHTVSHTSASSVIGGILFGKANHESYGFPVGLLLAPINSPCHPSLMVVGDKIDNDCDGDVDEEKCDEKDNDEDGQVDEDCSASNDNDEDGQVDEDCSASNEVLIG